MAELTKMQFGTCTQVDLRNHTLMKVQILACKGTILRVKGARPGYDRWSIYSKRLSREQHQYGADADWGAHLSWLRGPAVERRSLASALSLSCARPVADG